MGQREYGGVIWTDHALERIGQRGLTQSIASSTVSQPDEIVSGKKPGTHEYTKKVGTSTVTVITALANEGKPLVLSVWVDPPLAGTNDAKKQQDWKNYKKSGFWGKMFYALKRQLFVK